MSGKYNNIMIYGLWIFSWLPIAASANPSPQLSPWLVYYGSEISSSAFDPYQLVILEKANHLLASTLSDRGKTVLAYLSVGEVRHDDPWFATAKDTGLVLMESKERQGSFLVDIRDTRWASHVIEQLIPDILRRGFQGVLLDTLDSPMTLEGKDGNRYSGMSAAAARLVLTIRRHYPEIKIMMKRSYELLPEVGKAIDMALAESVFSKYRVDTGTYGLVTPETYQLQLEWLRNAARNFPRLAIYSLDYWEPDDKDGVAKIYKQERDNGFSPLVSTIALDRIIPPPQEISTD